MNCEFKELENYCDDVVEFLPLSEVRYFKNEIIDCIDDLNENEKNEIIEILKKDWDFDDITKAVYKIIYCL